jgi:hypothetical protein
MYRSGKRVFTRQMYWVMVNHTIEAVPKLEMNKSEQIDLRAS